MAGQQTALLTPGVAGPQDRPLPADRPRRARNRKRGKGGRDWWTAPTQCARCLHKGSALVTRAGEVTHDRAAADGDRHRGCGGRFSVLEIRGRLRPPAVGAPRFVSRDVNRVAPVPRVTERQGR